MRSGADFPPPALATPVFHDPWQNERPTAGVATTPSVPVAVEIREPEVARRHSPRLAVLNSTPVDRPVPALIPVVASVPRKRAV
eukprot:gene35851-44208_t